MAEYLNRHSDYEINPLFIERVSTRAFSDERLTDEELMMLFEAAHWAPSSYNNQPWRFVYGKRGTRAWDVLFEVLVDFNKSWVKNADVLVLVVAKKNFEHNGKPSLTAPFDTGAAWMSLAIQAQMKNIVAHGMQGFNYELIKQKLSIPDTFAVQAMIALGKPGNPETLPEDLREKETPSQRKALKDILAEGSFPFT